MWLRIVKKLPTHYDVERLCIAFQELEEYVATFLLEWKQTEVSYTIMPASNNRECCVNAVFVVHRL